MLGHQNLGRPKHTKSESLQGLKSFMKEAGRRGTAESPAGSFSMPHRMDSTAWISGPNKEQAAVLSDCTPAFFKLVHYRPSHPAGLRQCAEGSCRCPLSRKDHCAVDGQSEHTQTVDALRHLRTGGGITPRQEVRGSLHAEARQLAQYGGNRDQCFVTPVP